MTGLATLLWIFLFVVVLPAGAVTGVLLLRRWVGAEVLARHNDVAGFIYAVIGVVYAVLLGFSALIVWEQFGNARESAEQEANALADLYRCSRVFPPEVRDAVERQVRTYTRMVIEKEWPAMARGQSSSESWVAYNELWRIYHEFEPQGDRESLWYAESLERMNALAEARRSRLLGVRSGVPSVMWGVLLVGGVITIGFSFMFGTPNPRAQASMTGCLALTIGVALLAIFALEKPYAGIMRVDPEGFQQVDRILELWRHPGVRP